jgi:hypothetical protein
MLNLRALPHAPQRLNVDYPYALADVPVCFTDCETTGLHQGRRVWEWAAVRREPNGTMFALELMVSDVDLSQADEEGLRIGRFDQRHPARGGDPGDIAVVPELEVAQCIAEFVRGAHIAGAVPNFDVWSYQEMLARHSKGLDPFNDEQDALLRQLYWEGHYHLIDVENLVAGRLALPPPYDSDKLTAAVGVRPVAEDRRHTAMGDVLWGMRLYDAAMTGVGDFPVEVPMSPQRLAELRSNQDRPGLLAEPGQCCRDAAAVDRGGIIVTGQGECSDAAALADDEPEGQLVRNADGALCIIEPDQADYCGAAAITTSGQDAVLTAQDSVSVSGGEVAAGSGD